MIRIIIFLCSCVLAIQSAHAEKSTSDQVADSIDLSTLDDHQRPVHSESSSDDMDLNEEDLEYLAQLAYRPPAWYDPFLDRILNKIATIRGFIEAYAFLLKLRDSYTVPEKDVDQIPPSSESRSDNSELSEDDLDLPHILPFSAWYDPFLDKMLYKIASISVFIQAYTLLLKLCENVTVSETPTLDDKASTPSVNNQEEL